MTWILYLLFGLPYLALGLLSFYQIDWRLPVRSSFKLTFYVLVVVGLAWILFCQFGDAGLGRREVALAIALLCAVIGGILPGHNRWARPWKFVTYCVGLPFWLNAIMLEG